MALANDGGVPRRTKKVKRKNTSTGRNGPRQGLRGNQGLRRGEKSDSGSEIGSGQESDPAVVRDRKLGREAILKEVQILGTEQKHRRKRGENF